MRLAHRRTALNPAIRRTLPTVALALVVAAVGGALAGAGTLPTARPPALRVGTSGDYPPFSERAPDGTLDGFDVAIARAYARARGRALALVPFRWPELRARLLAGDFDVAMGGVTVRADRLVDGWMTAAVARADAVLVARAGAVPGDFAGRRVAVNRGGHLERVARAALPEAVIVPLDDNRALGPVLARGDADAIVTDTRELGVFDPSGTAFVVVRRLGRDRKAYWIPAAGDALAADLDAWILAGERDGTLPALRARWLGAATDAAPATGAAVLGPEAAGVADLLGRRLMLMPLVAAAKRARGLPIEDRAREAEVVIAARRRAVILGLPSGPYVALVRAEITAAKAVQHATPPAPADAPPPPDLAALRAAIDRIDTALAERLTALPPSPLDPGALAAALRDDTPVPGLTDADVQALARAVAAFTMPAPGNQRAMVPRRPSRVRQRLGSG